MSFVLVGGGSRWQGNYYPLILHPLSSTNQLPGFCISCTENRIAQNGLCPEQTNFPIFKRQRATKAVPLKSEYFSQFALQWDNQDKKQCPPISFFFRKQDFPPKKMQRTKSPLRSCISWYLERGWSSIVPTKQSFFQVCAKKHILWINLCLECHKSNLPVQRGMFIGMEIVIYISCTKLHSKKWLNSKTTGWDSFCWIPLSLRNDEVMSMK